EASAGMVLVDEAYAEFADGPSAVTLLERHPRLMVSRTMSKAFALAGARLGYLAASSDVVDVLRLVRLAYHLSALPQAAARVAHEPLGLQVLPTEATFPRFGPCVRRSDVWQALLERAVLVRDVSSGPGLPGWTRVTAGTEAETTTFLTALAALMPERHPERTR